MNAGHFAARWVNICKAFGLNAVSLDTPWGQPVDPEQVDLALKQHPDTTCVFGTLSETSTGTGHPIEAIGRVVARTPALLAVDGIGRRSHGVPDRPMGDRPPLRGLSEGAHVPPGLAFVAVSPKAWARIDSFDGPSYYFNLKLPAKR